MHLPASCFLVSFFFAKPPFAHVRLAKLVVFMPILAAGAKCPHALLADPPEEA